MEDRKILVEVNDKEYQQLKKGLSLNSYSINDLVNELISRGGKHSHSCEGWDQTTGLNTKKIVTYLEYENANKSLVTVNLEVCTSSI